MPGPDTTDLAAIEVLDPTGRVLLLGSFWRQRPIVLALVRHFG